MPIPVILDTDIGGDVDDLLALAVLLASPEIDLRAVTCVYGDARTRARIASKALSLAGRSDIPVAVGAERALNPDRMLMCGPDRGEGLLTPLDLLQPLQAQSAAQVIVDAVINEPSQIHLVAIGPLTNLALALLREPAIATNVAGITIMGGVVGGAGRLELPWVDYNFQCDPEAARIVLACGASISLVPIDVTMQIRIYPSDVAALRAKGDAFHLALADHVERYPRYQELGSTYLHDPLAAATLIRPDLVSWTPIHADVETGGDHSAGKLTPREPAAESPENARIAIGVDVKAAHDFVVSRLLA